MMDSTARLEAKAKLAPIVEKLVQDYAPDRVYLFGSLASGTFSEESDADLLVVKTTAQGALERSWEAVRKAIDMAETVRGTVLRQVGAD